jgi:two-component system, NtrC family, sensor kinase
MSALEPPRDNSPAPQSSATRRSAEVRRILVIDDNPSIVRDFRKVLGSASAKGDLDWIHEERLGVCVAQAEEPEFLLDAASSGEVGVESVRKACAEGRPYAVAFVDMRLGSGWDGITTIAHLWRADANVQVVICSAYSDCSWEYIRRRLGVSNGLLILKKPFDTAEISQLAHALTSKWSLHRAERRRAEELEEIVRTRTHELEAANRQLTTEIAERRKMEAELRLAQKLEAIGQLAAGIAHEINTPTQYVSDNVHFLRGSFASLVGLREKLHDSVRRLGTMAGTNAEAELATIADYEEDIDYEYLAERAPKAVDAALEGLDRIARIVRAMRDFGHHDTGERTPVDLNHAILTTLEVARNEYKYVADVETELAPLPAVLCLGGEINQVFLNLIVNAAHAIRDRVKDTGAMGKIRIATQVQDSDVIISVADTGTGIPKEIERRVFDPFFTTKEVGRGTGQGLAIARSVVVDKHGGQISFETEVGCGTTFKICIPIRPGQRDTEAAA